MTTKKTSALGSYKTPTAAAPAVKQPASNGSSNRPGEVPVQIWMSKADRLRLKKFAMDQEESLQSIVTQGINLVLKAKGVKLLGQS